MEPQMGTNPLSRTVVVVPDFPTQKAVGASHPVLANPPPDLHVHSALGDLSGVQWALHAGADPSATGPSGFRPLHIAAAHGRLSVLKELIARGAKVDLPSEHARAMGGCTPLHVAVACGHEAIVECLLASGARVDRRDEAGFTALHTAALTGARSILKRLLLAGAATEPFVADSTPLDLAQRAGHHEVVGLLRQVTGRR